MPHQVTIELADHWNLYLDNLVRSGRFESADHATEHALRRLEDNEAREDRLACLLEEGEQSGDAGPWDYDLFIAEMRERNADRKAA